MDDNASRLSLQRSQAGEINVVATSDSARAVTLPYISIANVVYQIGQDAPGMTNSESLRVVFKHGRGWLPGKVFNTLLCILLQVGPQKDALPIIDCVIEFHNGRVEGTRRRG